MEFLFQLAAGFANGTQTEAHQNHTTNSSDHPPAADTASTMLDNVQPSSHSGPGHTAMGPQASSAVTPSDTSSIKHEIKPVCPQEANKTLGSPHDTQLVSAAILAAPLNVPEHKSDMYEERLQEMTGRYRAKVQELSKAKAKLDEYAAQREELETELAKESSLIEGIIEEANTKLHEARRAYAALKKNSDTELAKKNNVIHDLKKDAKAKMDEKDGLIAKLQQEALAHVDRHQPAFDSTIVSAFDKVNLKINALVRRNAAASSNVGVGGEVTEVITLDKFAEAVLLNHWGRLAVKSEWHHRHVAKAWRSDPRVRALMLRAMVWNFLARELFDFKKPFAALNSTATKDIGRHYMEVFLDPITSDENAKWRALTAKILTEFEAGYPELRKALLERLQDRFVDLIYNEIAIRIDARPPLTRDFVHQHVKAGMARDLEPVLQAAIELATLTSKERAWYQLYFPNLRNEKYHKGAEHPFMTTDPTSLAINVRMADYDDDEEGSVCLLASPVLLKWGNGAGEGLNQYMVLRKAFVWRSEEVQV
ncbi:hypothetical protein GGTG_13696 [Gaeumannomyces tritici R3-111a-1]|uniref:Uncharacterized protein n=1 Tax=Gaeumannomyces tritici (strain R3-111a-1) TaxID=644352 RepID=J3PJL0_GAET3|nr:hypothetical protein GGTG_13696 [Gaeumannomyces tritici R3-111a-1]EJT68731.1 hypothetical protein GGTG_13696 [Gaeumannomyces tritici R3-111a-1]